MATAVYKYKLKACVSSYSKSIYFGQLVLQRKSLDNTGMFTNYSNPENAYLKDRGKDTLHNK